MGGCWALWVKVMHESGKLRAGRRTAEEMAKLREKQDESRRKFLLAMTEGQAVHAKEVMKSVLSAWKAHLSELRKERIAEERAMALLIGGQSRLVLQETFHKWLKMAHKAHA